MIKSTLAVLLLSSVAFAGPIQSERTQALEIGVLSDTEGMKFRLDTFIRDSGIFTRSASGQVELLPGKAFVFGGDVMDRGDSGREITEMLIDLKTRYPDRVTLIIGNRDLRQFLVPAEMSDEGMREDSPDFNKFLIEDMELQPARFKHNKYLKAMSLFGEGAEFRLAELRKTNASATHEDAVESFLNDMKPNGLFARYLQLAQFGFVDNETKTIFVHGAVRAANAGLIPGVAGKFDDPRAWIKKLNEDGRKIIELAVAGSKQARDMLISYGTIGKNKSVANARFDDSAGVPAPPEESVQKWLESHGIQRIVVGHTPTGEAPVLAREGNFQIVMVDGSFNKSEISPVVILKGDTVTSRAVSPEFGTATFSYSYGEKSSIGLRTKTDIAVGNVGKDILLYHIGPKFSRVYGTATPKKFSSQLYLVCADIFAK